MTSKILINKPKYGKKCLICKQSYIIPKEKLYENFVCTDCRNKLFERANRYDKQEEKKMPKEEVNMAEDIRDYNLGLSDSQKRIVEITEGMKDLLLYKNKKYGDSALKPKHRFYKGDSTNSILIRLDDKIGRIESNTDELPSVNDVADIIGYLTLLLVSMGVTKADLHKFMD